MKVFIETYGCTFNQADSESMAFLLKKAGFSLSTEKEADLFIINTCTVKAATERKTLHRIKTLSSSGKKLIIAGCMSQTQPSAILEAAPKASLIGTFAQQEIVPVAEKTLQGIQIKRLSKLTRSCLPAIHLDPLIGIIQISQGCLGSCSYCAARLARGQLRSFPVSGILSAAKKALKDGCRELRLTSQDCAVFGSDTGESLDDLLQKVLSLPGDFRVRLGMMNPAWVLKQMPALLSAYSSPKMYKFVHIPAQSGSDKVLKSMNRFCSVSDFKRICSTLKSSFPDITIATDIIVGYPTETEEDFKASLSLITSLHPDIVNISRFTPRPDTPAALLKPLKSQILKERSRKMSALCKTISLENNKALLGKKDRILLLKKNKDNFIGRSSSYKSVVLKAGKLGDFVDVEFKEAHTTHLSASKAF